MNITKQRKERIEEQRKVLDEYKEVEDMEQCELIHMYPTKDYAMFNDGFHDAKLFELWAFNTKTSEKCNLGIKDEIVPYGQIQLVRVFVDGSIVINFGGMRKIGSGNSCSFYEIDKT